MTEPAHVARAAYTLETFCTVFGVGRTKLYDEINAGRLKAVRVGRRVLIRATDADAWLAALPAVNRTWDYRTNP
ncbi:helix-turn-helix domain-containing protein [Xanthobacter sp. KR7-225]|jgi:excisionase family DNA binding protein|uniref:helix-turn-helix domain-containing protein n=1 Tax=Xanthobacter sp. KR7-225 TaxID=3156613 RepID=UPI0032B5C88B